MSAQTPAQPAGQSGHADRDRGADVFTETRPWGDFQQLSCNEPTTVKVITVLPGHRLSLQSHRLRGELWRVLDVPMDITVGERTWSAQPGELVWVPTGAVHRMGNSGQVPARILEVGFGRFDENDIERIEDDYTR
jgi:mannose-6-phosphate isomerase-like protein (cupin superfamily)